MEGKGEVFDPKTHMTKRTEKMIDTFLGRKNYASEHREGASFRRDFKVIWEVLREELREKIKNPKKIAYIAAYSILGNVTYSAKCAGISPSTVYNWKKKDSDFKEQYEIADQAHLDYMEMEAQRRAIEGTSEDVYYKGEVVGHKSKYSDNLLKFLLEGKDPSKYGKTNRIEVNSSGEGDVQVNFGIPELNQKIDTEEVIEVGE
jgi:hypothetical protein